MHFIKRIDGSKLLGLTTQGVSI